MYGSGLLFIIIISIQTILSNRNQDLTSEQVKYPDLSSPSSVEQRGVINNYVDDDVNSLEISNITKRFEILFMTHNDTFIEFNELVSESSERKYQDIDPIKIKRSLDSLSSVIWNQRTQYSTSLINSELNSEYESKLSSNLLESSFILYKLTSQLSFIVGLIGDVKNDPKNFDFNSFVKQVETQSSLFGEYEIKLKELNEYIFQSNNNL